MSLARDEVYEDLEEETMSATLEARAVTVQTGQRRVITLPADEFANIRAMKASPQPPTEKGRRAVAEYRRWKAENNR
jgi:hypothetical protein